MKEENIVIIDGIRYEIFKERHTAVIVSYPFREKHHPFKGEMKRIVVPIEECEVNEVKYDFEDKEWIEYRVRYKDEEIRVDEIPEAIMPLVCVSPLKDLKIPTTISVDEEEYKVVCIDDSAFHFCNVIRTLELPATVWRALDYAFCACRSLKTLILHGDLNVGYTKPESVFSGCPLSDIYLYYPLDKAEGLLRWFDELDFDDVDYANVISSDKFLSNLTLHVYKDTDTTSEAFERHGLKKVKVICDL